MNDHYKNNVETIEVIEDFLGRESIPAKEKYLIGNAIKYLLRAGKKTTDWKGDITKALDYLHRSLYGEWFQKDFKKDDHWSTTKN